MDKTMGWCATHVTSQSDASRDFHVKDDDCEGFTSAKDLVPDVEALVVKATKIARIGWIVALGVYVLFVGFIFLIPGVDMSKALIGAAAFLVAIPIMRALAVVVAEAIKLTDEDKRLIPKVRFLSEHDILTEDDMQGLKPE